MRNMLLCIFLFSFLESTAQMAYPIRKLSIDSPILKSVLRIADSLGLSKRDNLRKDSAIEIYVDSDLQMFSGKYLMSYYKKSGEIIGEGTDSAYLTTPHIVLSPLLYSVFYHQIDTAANIVVKSESIIVHELAHYIQSTKVNDDYYYPKNLSKEEMQKYLGHEDELYASAIEAYYFYEKTNKQFLDGLLKSSGIKSRIIKLLVTTKYNESYPWREPISLK